MAKVYHNHDYLSAIRRRAQHTGCPKKLCPVCLASAEESWVQLSWFLHCCIGQAST